MAVAFTASFCWALYSVLVKRPSARLGPIRSFGLISFITSALLLPLTLIFGKIATPLSAGVRVNLILIVSAVTCISLAHVLYYIAIRKVGVALSQCCNCFVRPGRSGYPRFFSANGSPAAGLERRLLLFGAFLAMRVKTTPNRQQRRISNHARRAMATSTYRSRISYMSPADCY